MGRKTRIVAGSFDAAELTALCQFNWCN